MLGHMALLGTFVLARNTIRADNYFTGGIRPPATAKENTMQNPADLFTLNDAILLDEIAALRDVLTRRTLTEPTAERLIALEREAAIRGLSLGALRS